MEKEKRKKKKKIGAKVKLRENVGKKKMCFSPYEKYWALTFGLQCIKNYIV